ncbi:hypothetical protein HK099_003894 [Clydaea vesicula]|uniref:Uncharacterized protein n=1 Tax=Clydaea vesicula TaxID=447962 RepID=A0AAD5U5P0_9FUNG|nr:hypothetical protein HK099_003894 [Clydaea vesicula]
MSALTEPVYEGIDLTGGNAKLHVNKIPQAKLEMIAKGKYVMKNENTGMYISTQNSILPADDANDTDNGEPFVLIGNEEDISGRLTGATRPIYTLPIGVGWNSGEKTSMFCFDDAILEYRKNIDKASGKINKATGTQPRYMVTYASIGIPMQRYKWLVEFALEANVTIIKGPKDQEHNNYLWINVNITRDYIPPMIVILASNQVKVLGDSKQNLKSALMTAKKNFIGVVAMEINLKRSAGFTENRREYLLSPSLKMMQVIDETDISSPPLNKAVEFSPKNVVTSARLLDSLRGRPTTASEGESIIGGTNNLPGYQTQKMDKLRTLDIRLTGAIRFPQGRVHDDSIIVDKHPLIDSVTQIMNEAIQSYIMKSSIAMYQTIDERICIYLSMIPSFLPIKVMMIGQEPYALDILPSIGSAFAFNPLAVNGFTPSIQVLSQFICMGDKSRISHIADLLSCSYVLLNYGIICINVHPSSKLRDQEKMKVESYFSELCSNIILSSKLLHSTSIELICLGDVASKTIKSMLSSIPSEITRSIHIAKVYLQNPVFVSRSRRPIAIRHNITPSDTCEYIEKFMNTELHEIGLVSNSYHNQRVVISHDWYDYHQYSLILIGNNERLAKIFNQFRKDIILQIREQNIDNLLLIAISAKDHIVSMSNQQKDTNKRGMSDYQYSIYNTLRIMLENGTEIKNHAIKVSRDVHNAISKLNPDDRESVTSLVSCIDDFAGSLSTAIAFFASINPALTSQTSYIDITGASIPPIIKTATPQIYDVDFASALSEDLGKSSQSSSTGQAMMSSSQIHNIKVNNQNASKATANTKDTKDSNTNSRIPPMNIDDASDYNDDNSSAIDAFNWEDSIDKDDEYEQDEVDLLPSKYSMFTSMFSQAYVPNTIVTDNRDKGKSIDTKIEHNSNNFLWSNLHSPSEPSTLGHKGRRRIPTISNNNTISNTVPNTNKRERTLSQISISSIDSQMSQISMSSQLSTSSRRSRTIPKIGQAPISYSSAPPTPMRRRRLPTIDSQ